MRDAALNSPRQTQRSGPGRRPANPSAPVLSSAAVAAQRLGGGRPQAAAASRPPGRRGSLREIRDEPGVFIRLRVFLARLLSFKAVGAGAFSLVLIVIVANAVWFQKGRHPAPLFATGPATSEPESPPLPPLPTPRPPVAEAETSVPPDATAAPSVAAAQVEAPAPASPVKTVSAKPVTGKPRHDDGIARLLLGQPLASDTGSMAEAAPGDKKPKLDAGLRATQRQLVKLGYALTPDGRMSGATRGAIEAFERQQHLPADSDTVTPELRRRIAAAVAAGLDKDR